MDMRELNDQEITAISGGEIKQIGTCGYKGWSSVGEVWDYVVNAIKTTWGVGTNQPKPDPWQ